MSGIAGPIGAAVVALVLSSAGPAAAGSGYGQLIANPGTVAPGHTISILGTCPRTGTPMNGVFSSAFVGGAATLTVTSINFSGTATISSNASGKYTVTADCGGGNPSVTITVSTSVTSTHPVTTSPAATHSSVMMTTPPASTKAAAIVGGSTPAKTTTTSHAPSSPAMTGAQAMGGTPGKTAAGNGPVTSTGIVRVGLAGASHSALTMTGAAAIAVAIALAGGVGFLVIRRRRNTPGSHI